MIQRFTLALAVVAFVGFSAAAPAQVGPGAGGVQPLPGSGNSAEMTKNNREQNEAYNSIIGKVGADPVGMEKAKRAVKTKAVPATAADIMPGAVVRDVNGAALGKVESIDGDSAILVYSSGKIRFPLVGFGKDPQGLLISLTTKDFLALVQKAKVSG
ncbi:MAG: hypothetical protein ABIO43_12250 [Sphingomicrobium sp.]